MTTRFRPGPGILRLVVPAVALALSWLVLSAQLAALSPGEVLRHLAAVSPARGLVALTLVGVAFVGVVGQERAVMAHFALALPPARQRLAAATAAAVSQATGFGPLVGALVRHRLVPELGLARSVAVSVAMTAGFLLGLAALAGLGGALLYGNGPGLLLALGLAVALLGLLGAACARRLPPGWRLPNLIVAGRFLGWLAVDLGALCTVLWLLLPGAPPLGDLAPLFLVAFGAGMASGSPSGIGPFEAAMALGLPQIDGEALVAGLVLFRLFAFGLPALAGLAVLLLAVPRAGPAAPGPRPAGVSTPLALPWAALAQLPRAEAQLVRQGDLHLIASGGDAVWLSGALLHARVLLGDPMAFRARAPVPRPDLAALRAAARDEARVPCLYKAGPRLAAAARAQGFRVLPVAREAVLDPAAFATGGGAREGWRTKAARERKASGQAGECARLPLDEMEAVARAWRRSHGHERGFSMGVWNRHAVVAQRVFAARGPDGRLLAFVSFHVAADEWALDLVRYRAGLPDGTMYLLVLAAIEAARRDGLRRLTLAAVPETAFRPAGSVLSAVLQRRAAGLLQFKAAFAPRWERRYIAAPGRLSLALAALDIALAIRFPPPPAPVPAPPGPAAGFAVRGLWPRTPGLRVRGGAAAARRTG